MVKVAFVLCVMLVTVVLCAQEAPEIAFTSPLESSTVANQVRLEVAIDPALGQGTVNYYLDLPSPPTVPKDWEKYIIGGSNFSPYSILWNATETSEGRHTITAVAALKDGKQVTATVTVAVQTE